MRTSESASVSRSESVCIAGFHTANFVLSILHTTRCPAMGLFNRTSCVQGCLVTMNQHLQAPYDA
jgi:hypothetical protein